MTLQMRETPEVIRRFALGDEISGTIRGRAEAGLRLTVWQQDSDRRLQLLCGPQR